MHLIKLASTCTSLLISILVGQFSNLYITNEAAEKPANHTKYALFNLSGRAVSIICYLGKSGREFRIEIVRWDFKFLHNTLGVFI